MKQTNDVRGVLLHLAATYYLLFLISVFLGRDIGIDGASVLALILALLPLIYFFVGMKFEKLLIVFTAISGIFCFPCGFIVMGHPLSKVSNENIKFTEFEGYLYAFLGLYFLLSGIIHVADAFFLAQNKILKWQGNSSDSNIGEEGK